MAVLRGFSLFIYGDLGLCFHTVCRPLDSLHGVITKKYQFDAFKKEENGQFVGNERFNIMMNYLNSGKLDNSDCNRVIFDVTIAMYGKDDDPTHGATLYYSPKAYKECYENHMPGYPTRFPKFVTSGQYEQVSVEGLGGADFAFYRKKRN